LIRAALTFVEKLTLCNITYIFFMPTKKKPSVAMAEGTVKIPL